MPNVTVKFGGSDPETADLARRALQPVLDSIYRTYRRKPLPFVEAALRRAGRGSFSQAGIERFADYISRGDRPILTK